EYKQKSPAVGRQKTGDFTEKSTVERFKDFRLSAPKKSASEMAKSSYFLFISGCRGHGFRFDGFFLRSFLAVLLQTQQYVDIYMVRSAFLHMSEVPFSAPRTARIFSSGRSS